MQHYITADPRVDRDQVEIYAPFDGYVLSDALHTLADGITMIPKSGVPWWPFNQWRINFPHTHVLPEFQNSPIHEMKAGDVVGYINSMDRYGGVGINDTEGKRKKGMCDDPEYFVNNPDCSNQ